MRLNFILLYIQLNSTEDMTLIDGKATSDQIKQEIAAEVAARISRGEKRPHLAAILVGHDGGSETYVANKVKACEVCGFKSTLIRYEDDVTEEILLKKIAELNDDDDEDLKDGLEIASKVFAFPVITLRLSGRIL